MRTIILALITALTAVTAAESPPPVGETVPAAVSGDAGAPVDARRFGSHTYLAYDENLSWHAAKQRCEDLGGHLAVITSPEEQAFVAQLADGRYLYVGATDEVVEDTWVWVTDEPFTYTTWFDGQPNNYGGTENYLATYDGGEWVDVDADGDDFWMPTGFICEWE